jgi:hypothetical protein
MATADEKRKGIIAGVAGAIALGFVLFQVWGFLAPTPPPVQVAPVIIDKTTPGAGGRATGGLQTAAVAPIPGGKAATQISSTGQLDPSLHMEGMLAAESLVYSGTGRNIFAPGAEQAIESAKVEAPKFPVRPNPPAPQVIAPTGPPPPTPVNLKFFGTATQNGVRKALLLGGDDVFLASQGDIVQRRYRIVTIAANSIVVEDLPNTNQQTLPLLSNP